MTFIKESKLKICSINIFIALLFLLPVDLKSQIKDFELALIEDKDGFTNIRKGMGTDYEVFDKILEGEFFYCLPTEKSWWEVELILWKGLPVKVYIHKSRIKLFLEMEREKQIKIINDRIDLFTQIKQKEDKEGKPKEFNKSSEFIAEKNVEPILSTISHLICEEWDLNLVKMLIQYIELTPGSASELTGEALGSIYWCHSDKLLEIIEDYEPDFRDRLLKKLSLGFDNFIWGMEHDEKFDENKAKNLKEKLKNANQK